MPGSTDSNNDSDDLSMESRIIQITNIAPQASKEQLQAMFGIIGRLEDLRLYPTMQSSVQARICFLKFADPNDVAVAMHLSNTVFIDRALVVVPYSGIELPDESKGLEMLSNVNSFGILEPKLPATLTNQVEGVPPHQVIRTLDPRLSMHNLPTYPLLPASTDPRRLEEIRRTIVVVNVDPSLSERKVVKFFSPAGEVKFMRFCSKKGEDTKYAMIEFVEQESIVPALKLNNKKLGNNIIKVTHSTQAIVKPVTQNKSNEAAQKEIEEEVNRVKEAQQSLLATPVVVPEEIVEKEKVVVAVEKAPIKPVEKVKEKEKEVKKSRSRSRTRSKSRSRRRSSSRSRRRKDRSRSRKRSRSRSRKRSRTRSRSRSRDRRKRSRSRSRDRRKKSRSRERRRRSRSRSRSRKKSPRPSRDRGRDRSPKERTKDRVEKTKEKKDRTKDRERKEKKKDKKEKKERAKTPSSKESSDEKASSGGHRTPRTPSPPPIRSSKGRSRRSKSLSRERSC